MRQRVHRLAVVRTQLRRAQECLARLGEAALVAQRDAEVVMRRGELRIDRQRLPAVVFRLRVVTAQTRHRPARQARVRVQAVGLADALEQRQRLVVAFGLEGFERLFSLAAQQNVRFGHAGSFSLFSG